MKKSILTLLWRHFVTAILPKSEISKIDHVGGKNYFGHKNLPRTNKNMKIMAKNSIPNFAFL